MLDKKKIYLLLAGIAVVMIVLEVLLAHPHHHNLWNVVPGADLLIGFAGAWAFIVLSKIVMNKLLRRDENYYKEDKQDD